MKRSARVRNKRKEEEEKRGERREEGGGRRRRAHLDEGRAAEEEAKHVGHDVVTDDAGDGHDEPGRQQKGQSSNSSTLLPTYFIVYSFYLDVPDHPLKQVVDDQVRLSHHDQQGHVGPTELWRQHKAVSQTPSGGTERNRNVVPQRKPRARTHTLPGINVFSYVFAASS